MAELNIEELNERALNLIHEARNILDERADEDGNLKPEDKQTYERMMDQVDSIESRIEDIQRADKAESRAEKNREELEKVVAPDVIDRAEETQKSELRKWLSGESDQRHFDIPLSGVEKRQLSHGGFEIRDLATSSAAAGGNLVPTGFVNTLYEHMVEASAIRQTNVTVLTTSEGNDLQVPRTTSFGTAAIVGEGTALAEADPAFGQVTLGSWKYGQLLQITEELLTDESVNINDFLGRNMGFAIGQASGAHFITGTGTNQPRGVVTAVDADFGTAVQGTASTFEADNFINLQHEVASPYRRNAYWLMKDSSLRDVRKLKDGDGNYIWERSFQAGAPSTLLGNPVVTDPNVAARGSANLSVVYGDFSGYYIRDVNSVRLERSEHFAFSSDLITIRAILRTDGDLIDAVGNLAAMDTD